MFLLQHLAFVGFAAAVSRTDTLAQVTAAVVRRAHKKLDGDVRRETARGEEDPEWEPDWARVFQVLQDSPASFNAIQSGGMEFDLVQPASLESACDSLGEEPYLVHPFDTRIAAYREYENESHFVPSLAELQKMPSDEPAMEKLMARLAQSTAVRVAVLGGSMTKGSECETPEGEKYQDCAYSGRLERWLQKTLPRAAVSVTNMANGGTNTVGRLLEIQQDMRTAGKIDLWIIDHGVNDAVNSHASSWSDLRRNPYADLFQEYNLTGADIYSIATEALILKILNTDPNASFMMLASACAPCLAFRENELKIARHYRIPYVDYGFLVEQRQEECPYDISTSHRGDVLDARRNCSLWQGGLHPTWQGHQHVTDTIGYHMGRALSNVCKGDRTNMKRLVTPASPVWSKTALQSLSPCNAFSTEFSALTRNGNEDDRISSHGWNLTEDVEGKPGWIANEIGARINFRVKLGKVPSVGIGFLRSYEKMGKAQVEIIGRNGTSVPLGEIDGLWDDPLERTSTTDTRWFFPNSGYKAGAITTLGSEAILVVKIIHSVNDPRCCESHGHKMKIINVVSC
jgi:hypothetical protein